MTVFWDWKGILLLEYNPVSVNTTQNTHEEMLKALRTTICQKHPEVHGEDIVFLYMLGHIQGVKLRTNLRVLVFGRLPYSTDLARSDFFLFPLRNKLLNGPQFTTDAQVKNAVNSFFHQQPTEFFEAGMHDFGKCNSKCLYHFRTSVEK